jgi:hypothetical protein
MGRLGRLRSREEGQVLPVLLLLFVSILAIGFMLLETGKTGILRAEGVTSADAAAIAGGKNMKQQLIRIIAVRGYPDPSLINPIEACAHAEMYAARNGGHLTDCRVFGYEIHVATITQEGLGDGRASEIGVAGTRATADATARVNLFTIGFPSLSGGGLGGSLNVPLGQLNDLADEAGLEMIPGSVLAQTTHCAAGVDTANLSEEMKIAIIKAENILGHPLVLSDGFRTYGCQVAAAANPGNPGGRAATPGTSLHEFGMAIDVPSSQIPELAAIAHRIGLCQPFPAANDDPFHFSLASGPECGGRAGVLGSGGAFGGNVLNYFGFDVILIE